MKRSSAYRKCNGAKSNIHRLSISLKVAKFSISFLLAALLALLFIELPYLGFDCMLAEAPILEAEILNHKLVCKHFNANEDQAHDSL